jgi:hypothetical protein
MQADTAGATGVAIPALLVRARTMKSIGAE